MMAKRKEPQLSHIFETEVFSTVKSLKFGVNVNSNKKSNLESSSVEKFTYFCPCFKVSIDFKCILIFDCLQKCDYLLKMLL